MLGDRLVVIGPRPAHVRRAGPPKTVVAHLACRNDEMTQTTSPSTRLTSRRLSGRSLSNPFVRAPTIRPNVEIPMSLGRAVNYQMPWILHFARNWRDGPCQVVDLSLRGATRNQSVQA